VRLNRTHDQECFGALLPFRNVTPTIIRELESAGLTAFNSLPGPVNYAQLPVANRLKLDTSSAAWDATHMEPLAGSTGATRRFHIGADPIFTYRGDLSISPADYDYLYIQLALSPDLDHQRLQVFYNQSSNSDFSEERSVFDSADRVQAGVAEYFIPIPDFRAAGAAPLTGLRIDPVGSPSSGGANNVELRRVEFLKVRKTPE
jgi:hypothetical protein